MPVSQNGIIFFSTGTDSKTDLLCTDTKLELKPEYYISSFRHYLDGREFDNSQGLTGIA